MTDHSADHPELAPATSVYEVGHHWVILVPPVLVLAVGVFVANYFGALSHLLRLSPDRVILELLSQPMLIVGYLGGVMMLYGVTALSIALIKFFTFRVTVSANSVEYRVGLFGQLHDEMEIHRIESVIPNQGPIGFIFGKLGLGGFADVHLRGVGTGTPLFATVRNAYQLRDVIHQQMRAGRKTEKGG